MTWLKVGWRAAVEDRLYRPWEHGRSARTSSHVRVVEESGELGELG
jgi:hypothetical protein